MLSVSKTSLTLLFILILYLWLISGTYRHLYLFYIMMNVVYVSPQVEIIEVELEKGFATSDSDGVETPDYDV